MNWRRAAILGAIAEASLSSVVLAQPRDLPVSPATSAQLPAGIGVRKTPGGQIYVDARGRTLYGLDISTLALEMRSPYDYCTGRCAELWEPVTPPPGLPPTPAVPVVFLRLLAARGPLQLGPDWTVSKGASGPQLMFRVANLVFTRKGDRPGVVARDGADDGLWNVLYHVPPVPKVVAPAGVAPVLVDGVYALADGEQHLLFTMKEGHKCNAPCVRPMPFRASLIGRGVGDWTIARGGDFAQWQYRGQPVFVGEGLPKSTDLPKDTAILRPDLGEKGTGK